MTSVLWKWQNVTMQCNIITLTPLTLKTGWNISGFSLRHNCLSRDNDGPSFWCSVCRFCSGAPEEVCTSHTWTKLINMRLIQTLILDFLKPHLAQIVQSSIGAMLPPSLWLSEKSILKQVQLNISISFNWYQLKFINVDLCRGRGTMPGSVNTALAWAMNRRNIMMLKVTTWKLEKKFMNFIFGSDRNPRRQDLVFASILTVYKLSIGLRERLKA